MPFTLEFETAEEAPEVLRTQLTEKDGKFVFEGETLTEYQKQAKNLENARKAEKTWQKTKPEYERLTKFKDLSDDEFTEYTEWKAKKGEGDGKDHKDDATALAKWQAERDRAEKKLKDQHAAQLAEKEKAIADTTTKFQRFVMKESLTALALKNGVIPERIDSWRDSAAKHFRLNDHDELEVFDDDGETSPDKPEKFIAETLQERLPWFYAAKEKPGSGAENNGKGGAKAKTIKRAAFDALSQAAQDQKIKDGIFVVD